jgi:hypothetical protein
MVHSLEELLQKRRAPLAPAPSRAAPLRLRTGGGASRDTRGERPGDDAVRANPTPNPVAQCAAQPAQHATTRHPPLLDVRVPYTQAVAFGACLPTPS